MLSHGFQLHQHDLDVKPTHTPVASTSFFYVIKDGMNNFKSSLKRALRKKKKDLNLSRRPTSSLPLQQPFMQTTTSELYGQPQMNGAYHLPQFDPYTGQPLHQMTGPPQSFGPAPGGVPMYIPAPTTFPFCPPPTRQCLKLIHFILTIRAVGISSINHHPRRSIRILETSRTKMEPHPKPLQPCALKGWMTHPPISLRRLEILIMTTTLNGSVDIKNIDK
jgi:hypothetical protein